MNPISPRPLCSNVRRNLSLSSLSRMLSVPTSEERKVSNVSLARVHKRPKTLQSNMIVVEACDGVAAIANEAVVRAAVQDE